jgi:endonuclease/exonuclease/phosphatase family metal-dependent hydrolase
MTQNQYLGANLTPIIEAATKPVPVPAEINAEIIKALQSVVANLPEERFKALAGLIQQRKPHLVGLQEMFKYTCAGPGCSDPSIAGAFVDHLAGTMAALGDSYVVEAQVENLNLTLGFLSSTGPGEVTVIDRDVILARSDVADQVSSAQFNLLCMAGDFDSFDGCNYQVVGSVQLPGQATKTRIERGFVGVDATIAGKQYRFVNTHLEVRELEADNPYSRIVQSAQAYELLQTSLLTKPAGSELLIVGDINSDPRDQPLTVPPDLQATLGTDVIVPPYLQFMLAGFTDVWTLRPGATTGKGAPLVGYSCCQDELLGNHRSAHYERIDMIFSKNAPKKVKQARLLGESISDKTAPAPFGLWPSDHASVAALLQF